jgi:hypothetical protein
MKWARVIFWCVESVVLFVGYVTVWRWIGVGS